MSFFPWRADECRAWLICLGFLYDTIKMPFRRWLGVGSFTGMIAPSSERNSKQDSAFRRWKSAVRVWELGSKLENELIFLPSYCWQYPRLFCAFSSSLVSSLFLSKWMFENEIEMPRIETVRRWPRFARFVVCFFSLTMEWANSQMEKSERSTLLYLGSYSPRCERCCWPWSVDSRIEIPKTSLKWSPTWAGALFWNLCCKPFQKQGSSAISDCCFGSFIILNFVPVRKAFQRLGRTYFPPKNIERVKNATITSYLY